MRRNGVEEWKECKLKDIVEINPTESLKKGTVAKKIGMDVLQPYCRAIPSFSFEPYTGGTKFKNGDTIMARITPCLENGKTAMVNILDDNEIGFGSTEYIVFRAKNNITDPYFIYYLVTSDCIRNPAIKSMVGSSGHQRVQTDVVANLSIKLPPLPTQQKIAAILSSLDDKIELNNKINTNLEQQAGALFKNWFVDFEPFGGKMPEGWKLGKLSEYCNFQEGYVNPAQIHNEYFDGDVKWLRAVDINELFILNTSRTLTKCGFESAGKSAFLFKPGSIAISKSGTVGRLGIISDFMCGNRAVIGIELKEQQNLSYIHQYLKSRQTEFPDMAVGSVQKNLYVSILENLDIIIPSKEVLEKFAAICIPFYDQIKTNCVENNNLSSIRDTLLPKLMNGEIEVGEVII